MMHSWEQVKHHDRLLAGLISFSVVPLKLVTLMGFIVFFMSLAGILYALILRVFTDIWVTGWTALFIAILFIGGVQLLSLGIIGEYVGRIYGETKKRPYYIIEDSAGFNEQPCLEQGIRDRLDR